MEKFSIIPIKANTTAKKVKAGGMFLENQKVYLKTDIKHELNKILSCTSIFIKPCSIIAHFETSISERKRKQNWTLFGKQVYGMLSFICPRPASLFDSKDNQFGSAWSTNLTPIALRLQWWKGVGTSSLLRAGTWSPFKMENGMLLNPSTWTECVWHSS